VKHDPRFLWLRPLIVRTDGVILAGEMRWRAARHLGWPDVPAWVVEADEQRSKEIVLRDNFHAGEWVEEELAELIAEMTKPGEEFSTVAPTLGVSETAVLQLFEAFEPPELDDLPIPKRHCPSCGHEWEEL
jgi:ParB-like chromosome segregation protein Spo0J